MCLISALEQFLLLSDISFNNPVLLIFKPLIYIIVNLSSEIVLELMSLRSFMTDILFFNDLAWRFHFDNILSQINDLFDNVIFNLVNVQYYKLNFFLIFFVSSMAFYTTLVFPKTIFQLIVEKSHVMAQQILKPIFGNHYPFMVRFISIILFYIICFYLFYLITY
jgi:hypothetical protein